MTTEKLGPPVTLYVRGRGRGATDLLFTVVDGGRLQVDIGGEYTSFLEREDVDRLVRALEQARK